MLKLAERAQAALATAQDVPSPCISLCRMDARNGWCQGCWRTLDEIVHWAQMGDESKRAVWQLLLQRANTGGI